MDKSAKVAISLPRDVLEAVEMERKAKGESRSQFFRRAAEKLLQEERGMAAIQSYMRGYREIPERTDEIEAVHQLGSAVLGEEPWE